MVSGNIRVTSFTLVLFAFCAGCTQSNTASNQPKQKYVSYRQIRTGSNIPQGPSYMTGDQNYDSGAIDAVQTHGSAQAAGSASSTH